MANPKANQYDGEMTGAQFVNEVKKMNTDIREETKNDYAPNRPLSGRDILALANIASKGHYNLNIQGDRIELFKSETVDDREIEGKYNQALQGLDILQRRMHADGIKLHGLENRLDIADDAGAKVHTHWTFTKLWNHIFHRQS